MWNSKADHREDATQFQRNRVYRQGMGPKAEKQPTPGGSYRIVSPVLALFEEDGCHVARTIPAGAFVYVDKVGSRSEALTDVTWEGKGVMIFIKELRSFAEPA